MITRKMTLMQKLICNIKEVFQLRAVLADEPVAGTDPVATQTVTDPVQPVAQPVQPVIPMINYEQLIAQARQEEKQKLYPELTQLRANVKELTKNLNDALLQVGTKEARIQELTAELDKAKTGNADPAEITRLNETIATLTTENENFKKEAEMAKLTSFREAELAKYNNQVIPELITGTTEDEIAESIKASNARYLEIVGGVAPAPQAQQVTQPQAQPILQQQPQQPTIANPIVSGLGFDARTVTDDMIRNMSTAEYANWRKQVGIR